MPWWIMVKASSIRGNHYVLLSPYPATERLPCSIGDVDHGSADDDQPAANNIDSTGYVHHCTTNNHNSTGRLSLLLLVITREEQEHFVLLAEDTFAAAGIPTTNGCFFAQKCVAIRHLLVSRKSIAGGV